MTSQKAQLQASLANIEKHITSTLNSRLKAVSSSDVSLTKQTKALQSCTHEALKQQNSWSNLVRAGRNGMKDLGDVGNWAALLDREITFLERVVQQAQQ